MVREHSNKLDLLTIQNGTHPLRTVLVCNLTLEKRTPHQGGHVLLSHFRLARGSTVYMYLLIMCVSVCVCSVEEFVTAVKEVRASYLALPPETQCDTIIADFDARWEKGQADYINRPSRYFY